MTTCRQVRDVLCLSLRVTTRKEINGHEKPNVCEMCVVRPMTMHLFNVVVVACCATSFPLRYPTASPFMLTCCETLLVLQQMIQNKELDSTLFVFSHTQHLQTCTLRYFTYKTLLHKSTACLLTLLLLQPDPFVRDLHSRPSYVSHSLLTKVHDMPSGG